MEREHLLTQYIRTKALFGDRDEVLDDGTIRLKKEELVRLQQELDVGEDEIGFGKLTELVRRGEIRGYGNNFKATKKDGVTLPELLNKITGGEVKKVKNKATTYVKKMESGPGSRKFKECLSSKPLDKYFKTG